MFQEDLFAGLNQTRETLIDHDGLVEYYPRAVQSQQQLFQCLKATIDWRQDEIFLFGKKMPLPRLQAWHADPDCFYTYSNLTLVPTGWTPDLLAIKREVERLSSVAYNSVLLNYYRHERDNVAWHSDDEPELGLNPVIASLSLGARRQFELRHKTDKGVRKLKISLGEGDLLLMKGPLQANWQHRLVRSGSNVGERINLTFRTICVPTPIHAPKTLKIY